MQRKQVKQWVAGSAASLLFSAAIAQQPAGDYPIQPVAFTQVHLTDNFWRPRLGNKCHMLLFHTFYRSAGKKGESITFLWLPVKRKLRKLTDFPFDDTDLYKLLEGASYSLQEKYDAKLDREMDTLIQIIGDAQEPDGYLYTFRTAHVDKPHEWIGSKRWEKDEELSHELYNSGHLYESAVAHYAATGKKTFLNIAIKNADLLVKTFGPDKCTFTRGTRL